MIERDNLETLQTKLKNICEENGLIPVFKNKQYPVTLIIQPDTSGDAQMSLLEDGERPNPKGSELRFTFRDGKILYRTTGGIELSEATFNKLKNLFKKLHYAWLQVYFLESLQTKGSSTVVAGDAVDESDAETPPDDLDNDEDFDGDENFEGLPDDDGDLDESEE